MAGVIFTTELYLGNLINIWTLGDGPWEKRSGSIRKTDAVIISYHRHPGYLYNEYVPVVKWWFFTFVSLEWAVTYRSLASIDSLMVRSVVGSIPRG